MVPMRRVSLSQPGCLLVRVNSNSFKHRIQRSLEEISAGWVEVLMLSDNNTTNIIIISEEINFLSDYFGALGIPILNLRLAGTPLECIEVIGTS